MEEGFERPDVQGGGCCITVSNSGSSPKCSKLQDPKSHLKHLKHNFLTSTTITILIASLWCLPASTNQQYYQEKKEVSIFGSGMCRENQKPSKELCLKIQAVTFQKQRKCSLDPDSQHSLGWDSLCPGQTLLPLKARTTHH